MQIEKNNEGLSRLCPKQSWQMHEQQGAETAPAAGNDVAVLLLFRRLTMNTDKPKQRCCLPGASP